MSFALDKLQRDTLLRAHRLGSLAIVQCERPRERVALKWLVKNALIAEQAGVFVPTRKAVWLLGPRR